jgi:hypothetical protein
MTIKKGSPYGAPGVVPEGAFVASTDREVSSALEQARRSGVAFPTVGVTGGDLCHTLGGTGALQTAFPVDVGEVLIDGRLHYFVAHVAAHDRRWRRFAVAMNAQWIGEWNFGPKAHPNDGVVDAYEAQLGLFEWRKVRARLPTGTHLPHPRIRPTRAKAVAFSLDPPLPVYVDGENMGPSRNLAIRILPDALTVIA